MTVWTSAQLEKALGVAIVPGQEFARVEFNSMQVKPGDIFIALEGSRDGHEFVQDAIARGAAAVIISKDVDNVPAEKLIKVQNCAQALMDMAEYKRNQTKAKVIAVTGSVGKTTTKEMLKSVFSQYGITFANYGTFNNHIGVPLTLASIPNNAEYVIVELGMNHPGELHELTHLVVPDIAVLTSVSEGHIGFFKSLEEIADAKCEIFSSLRDRNAIAIINKNMSMYERCLHNIDQLRIKNVRTFGSGDDDAYANLKSFNYGDKLELLYNVSGQDVEIIIEQLPIYLAENISAVLAVVKSLGLDLAPAINGIAEFKPLMGRGRLVDAVIGEKHYKIICDYYNSNPQSLKAAISYLAQFTHHKLVAILGDMNELGEFSDAMHAAIIEQVQEAGVKKLLLVGPHMSKISPKFDPEKVKTFVFTDADSVKDQINDYLEDGEVILIKGSRGLALEKIAKNMGIENVF